MSAREQIEALKQQLLEAFIAREQAEEKIKAIRNVMAGIPLGQALASEAAPALASEAAPAENTEE